MPAKIYFALFISLLVSACRPFTNHGSHLREVSRYKQAFQFRSQVNDVRPALVLRGDFGSNLADRRHYQGGSQGGNFVSVPGEPIQAINGFFRATAKIKADFFQPWFSPVETISILNSEYRASKGSFVVDLVYRKPGQDPASPTIAASREIALESWTPAQDIDIGTANFEGNLEQFEVRVHDIKADYLVEISVYNTVVDAVWQTENP